VGDINLPQDGQINWGDPLNTAITQVDNDAINAQTTINTHTANVPLDPHGDRAFSQALFAPVTTGTNLPNGYVKLDGNGHIPASLISGTSAGGMYTGIFDAVGLFGMSTSSSDASGALQNALNAANSAGGGIVYVGPGTFSLANYVVIGNNTWLLLSEGTVLQRVQGATNPPYLVSNIQFGTSGTPSTSFKISGGKLDAVGSQGLSSACTPIFVVQASKIEIRDVWINNVFNNPAIELNGCSIARIDFVHFTGTGSNSFQPTKPAIRINSTETGTSPTGLANSLYNGSICQTIKITDCDTGPIPGTTFGTYGEFCGTDLVPVHHSKDIIITACSTRYSSNNFVPIDVSQWIGFSVDNCSFFETAGTGLGTNWFIMTLKNGFSSANNINGSNYPPSFKMNPDGSLAIRGTLGLPNTYVDGTVFATLGQAFGNNQPTAPACVVMQAAGNHAGIVTVDASGNLQLNGNFGNNINVYIDGTLRV
jgi:hypothetical protein